MDASWPIGGCLQRAALSPRLLNWPLATYLQPASTVSNRRLATGAPTQVPRAVRAAQEAHARKGKGLCQGGAQGGARLQGECDRSRGYGHARRPVARRLHHALPRGRQGAARRRGSRARRDLHHVDVRGGGHVQLLLRYGQGCGAENAPGALATREACGYPGALASRITSYRVSPRAQAPDLEDRFIIELFQEATTPPDNDDTEGMRDVDQVELSRIWDNLHRLNVTLKPRGARMQVSHHDLGSLKRSSTFNVGKAMTEKDHRLSEMLHESGMDLSMPSLAEGADGDDEAAMAAADAKPTLEIFGSPSDAEPAAAAPRHATSRWQRSQTAAKKQASLIRALMDDLNTELTDL